MALDDMNEGLLQVTNHRDHPINKAYKVFFFRSEEQADYFELLIKNNQVYYERDVEETSNGKIYLFGIRKTDLKIVSTLNYQAIGKFRNPFIYNKKVKYFILTIGLLILIFAVISFLITTFK